MIKKLNMKQQANETQLMLKQINQTSNNETQLLFKQLIEATSN